jgi:succinate dehydrogenase/fumarate reductase flavoprotein subunit
MDEIYQMKKDVGINDRGLVWNTDLIEAMELENLLSIIYIYNYHSPGQDDHRVSCQ